MNEEFFSSIEEAVEDNELKEISYRQLHTVCAIDDVKTNTKLIVPYLSLTNKYRHYLEKIIIDTDELDDVTLTYFRFSPKKMSLFLYGTTDYWYALMELNHCKSIIDFDKTKYKVYDPDELPDIINEILIKEEILK